MNYKDRTTGKKHESEWNASGGSPENQNQGHNAKKEALGPNTKR